MYKHVLEIVNSYTEPASNGARRRDFSLTGRSRKPTGKPQARRGAAETRRNSFSKTSVSPCPSGGCRTGDIAISAEVAARNALRLGHSAMEEMQILILHGLLHLAGYDHETDAGAMARKEARLRRAFGLPTALIERTTADGTHRPAKRPRS